MHRTIACAFFLCTASLFAGDANDDWSALIALDAGPGVTPKTAAEAYAVSLGHTEKQEKALRAFLAAHADDAKAFEALLRLARVLDLRADMKSEPQPAEVLGILEKAGLLATTPSRQTEFEFALLIRRMRKWRSLRPPIEERRAILEQARQFEAAHPGERRIASLLAEIAALFDFEPATKETLLHRAKKLTKDPDLTAQIADDLRRLAFLGKPLPLRFTALDGRRVDVKMWQGKVVGVVFFATWSAPSKAALSDLRRAIEAAGPGTELAAISLDADRADLESYLRDQAITCPVAWDGKGWDGPLMQALGINSVPTTWLLDTKGVLRSLDALEDPAGQIRRMLIGK
ncbi:MAG: TlpA disulfide reductase family protein [Chthoniobacteraceae bacterium]